MYSVQKNLNRIHNGQHTFFLDPNEEIKVKSKLKKNEYNIYFPYKDSEKNILYVKDEPKVLLFEIKSKVSLRHQDILGTLYSLNNSGELFGDVLIIDNHYYVFILDIFRNYFESNFFMVKDTYIELEELDVNYLNDYERKYEKLELIVSSNRIDTVVSSICHIGRNNIKDMQKNKEIILNYEVLKDISYKLKENDTFSIKKIGKFKYMGILKNTKSNNLIISIYKYI